MPYKRKPIILFSGHPNPVLGNNLLTKLCFPYPNDTTTLSEAIAENILLQTIDQSVEIKELLQANILVCVVDAEPLLDPSKFEQAKSRLKESIKLLTAQLKGAIGQEFKQIIRFIFNFPAQFTSLDIDNHTAQLKQLMKLVSKVDGLKYFYVLLANASAKDGLYYCSQREDKDLKIENKQGGFIMLLDSLNQQACELLSLTNNEVAEDDEAAGNPGGLSANSDNEGEHNDDNITKNLEETQLQQAITASLAAEYSRQSQPAVLTQERAPTEWPSFFSSPLPFQPMLLPRLLAEPACSGYQTDDLRQPNSDRGRAVAMWNDSETLQPMTEEEQLAEAIRLSLLDLRMGSGK